MNNRPVDKTKKSNIKCEHCQHYDRETKVTVFVLNHIEDWETCSLSGKPKCYWHRCKNFEWADKYKGD